MGHGEQSVSILLRLFRNLKVFTSTAKYVEYCPERIFCIIKSFIGVNFFFSFLLDLNCRQRRAKMLRMRSDLQAAGVRTDTTSVDAESGAAASAEATKKKLEAAQRKEQVNKNLAEIKEIKKEQRATRSLLILVGCFFVLWFSYELVGNFIMPICPDCVPSTIYQATYWIEYHISAINPLVYALTIERFKYHFQVFFSTVFPCCVRHPAREAAPGRNKVEPFSNNGAAVHATSGGMVSQS